MGDTVTKTATHPQGLIARAVEAVRVWGTMVKFSHSVFALPFALTATFLAARHLPDRSWPYPGQLLLIVICMVAARSVAMTFNRIVDAQIDARNPRTADRPIPAGRISMFVAWAMLGVFALTFGVACWGFFFLYANPWPIVLSGPVLLYICAYSFAKRFTRWSHFVLGSAIAMAPVAAWIAVSPESLGAGALLLLVAVTCWIAGFDILYACQDVEVDRSQGLHSLPARLGERRALWVARIAHAVTAMALIALAVLEQLGPIHAAGVTIVCILLVFEHRLVRPGDYRHLNVAFFTLNGIVSLVWALSAIAGMAVGG